MEKKHVALTARFITAVLDKIYFAVGWQVLINNIVITKIKICEKKRTYELFYSSLYPIHLMHIVVVVSSVIIIYNKLYEERDICKLKY